MDCKLNVELLDERMSSMACLGRQVITFRNALQTDIG